MTIDPKELAHQLAHYTGTEQWYRHGLNKSMLFTDGVKAFADLAGAYWFLDIVATELNEIRKKEMFILVKLIKAPGEQGARVVCDDGDGNFLFIKNIGFSDCPVGEWKFYYNAGDDVHSVLMLPSEY